MGPKDADSAVGLAKRMLAGLYNARMAWPDRAHKLLAEAVFAAYGWPADLADDAILERLLGLRLERASGKIGQG